MWSKRYTLDTLWQSINEQVYPERADYTVKRVEGDEYAAHLFESVPAQHRRDLASALGAMLRPRGRQWFRPRAGSTERNTHAARKWFDQKGEIMRNGIYSSRSNFSAAFTAADNDFVTIGNSVTSRTENRNRDGLIFQTWHPRDCVWAEDENGEVNYLQRKVKQTLAQKRALFGEKALSEAEKRSVEKDPHAECEVRHVAMDATFYRAYDKKRLIGKPWASIYYDPAQRKILREGGYFEFPYLVRRWARTSNSPYAYSPCAVLGLIDARLLQSMAEVILEAAEKNVDPPWLAVQDGVLGGVNTFAGGTTWIDSEYDSSKGDALKALQQGGDIKLGLDMKQDTREVHGAAWYLNKLNLPSDREMTAFETQERVQEYIRSIGPVIEPFEADNGRLLDGVWDDYWRFTEQANRAGQPGPFGFLDERPEELDGEEIKYEFDTPLQRAYEIMKASKARETYAYFAEAEKASQDPTVWDHVNRDKLARDGGMAVGGEAEWLNSEDDVLTLRNNRAQQVQQQEQAAQDEASLARAGAVLDTVPKAAQAKASAQEMMQGIPKADLDAIIGAAANAT